MNVSLFACSSIQRRWFLVSIAVVMSLIPASTLANPASSNKGCPNNAFIWDFYVGATGNVTDSGHTKEGPICVHVHYNRLRFNLALNFETTQGKGVDLSSVLLTGSVTTTAPGGVEKEDTRKAKLQNILAVLTRQDNNAVKVSAGIEPIRLLVVFLDNSIASQTAFPEAVVKEKYRALHDVLQAGQELQSGILVTDSVTGGCPQSVGNPAAGSILDTVQQYRSDADFYRDNQADVDSALNLANQYRCGAPKQVALPTNVAIVKFWDGRFQELGLSNGISQSALSQLALADFFVTSTFLQCTNIFNQSSSTTASLTTYDETQTLTGNLSSPNAQQDKNFFTLTCASPFAVSAGVEFSTIPSREFAIVKSTGGANSTSVNEFGYSFRSSFHPLPVALVHVRLWESADERFAFHISAGASGNLQGQNSGGSSAEFLTGGSVSFFRTMFLTAGVHVGTKTSLAGGFKVGDLVPSDITTVPITKSYTTGFGLAITFTKP